MLKKLYGLAQSRFCYFNLYQLLVNFRFCHVFSSVGLFFFIILCVSSFLVFFPLISFAADFDFGFSADQNRGITSEFKLLNSEKILQKNSTKDESAFESVEYYFRPRSSSDLKDPVSSPNVPEAERNTLPQIFDSEVINKNTQNNQKIVGPMTQSAPNFKTAGVTRIGAGFQTGKQVGKRATSTYGTSVQTTNSGFGSQNQPAVGVRTSSSAIGKDLSKVKIIGGYAPASSFGVGLSNSRPGRELAVFPSCRGQIHPIRSFSGSRAQSIPAQRTGFIFHQHTDQLFLSLPEQALMRLFFGNDANWQRDRLEIHTEDGYGVYIWYFPNLYLDENGVWVSGIYVGESEAVITRIVDQELAQLATNRYPNPVFQAVFNRARSQGSGIMVYVVEDETVLFSKEDTRELEVAYLNEIHNLMYGPDLNLQEVDEPRSERFRVVVANLKDTLDLATVAPISEIWNDSEDWDRYYERRYRSYLVALQGRNEALPEDERKRPKSFSRWRAEEEAIVFRGNPEIFQNSPRRSLTVEEFYRQRFNSSGSPDS